jgi:ankyrin repeat protein
LLDILLSLQHRYTQNGYTHTQAHKMEGSVLCEAAERGDEAGVREQLARGAGPAVIEFRGNDGMTPLMTASRHGRERCAELLLEAGAELEAMDWDGWTSLCYASYWNRPAVVSLLLAAGAQVDSATDIGWTPLRNAAYHGHSEVVRLLLDAGANRELRDNHHRTALDLATQYNKAEVVAILNEHERPETVARTEVVACSGLALPTELAELCGDYVAMTPERRAIQAKQKKQ